MNGSELLLRIDALGFVTAKHLLSLSWQFALLFAAALIAVWVLRQTSARIRHTVWVSVFVLLPVVALLVAAAGHIEAPSVEMQVMPTYTAPVSADTPPVTSSVQEPAPEVAHEPRGVTLAEIPWAMLFMLYAPGAVGFLALVVLGRLRLERIKKRGTVAIDARVLAMFMAVREQLGITRPFVIIESDALHAPLTMGTFHPVIMIPAGFAEKLPDAELRAFALHELAHVKRLDSMALTWVSLVRAVFFFNPLVWFAARQVAMLAETACDDLVVESQQTPLDYAEMLVRLARTLPKRELATELAAGFLISKHVFLRRVEQILADRRSLITKLPKWAVAGCLVFGLAAVMLVVAVPVGEVPHSAQAASRSDDTPTFRARIIDHETGEPVAGVHMIDRRGNELAVSDEDGRIILSDVGEEVEFYMEDASIGRFWSEQSTIYKHNISINGDIDRLLRTSFTTLTFNTSDQTEPVTIFTERSTTITGRVFDPYGNPLSDAIVTPGMHESGPLWGDNRFDVTTGRDGRYEIHIPASNDLEYHLIGHDGGIREFRTWANGLSGSFRTRPGQRIDNMDITLTRPGTIRGVVVDPDGNPKTNQDVTAFTMDAITSFYNPRTETNDRGEFEITHVRPGVALVITPGTGPSKLFLDHAPDGIMQEVTVASGQIVGGIRLLGYDRAEMLKRMKPLEDDYYERSGAQSTPETGTFRARVIDDATGAPVAGVRLRDENGKELNQLTDSNGYLTISDLLSGNIVLYADPERIGRWWSAESDEGQRDISRNRQPRSMLGSRRLTFTVSEDMEPVTIHVELPVTITGTVYDPDGNPVAGATVAPARTLSGNSITGDTMYSVKTDNNGVYSVELPASMTGVYNLVAHDGEYGEFRTWANGVTEPMQTLPGERFDNIDITLTHPATVKGAVVDTNGNPIEGVMITLTGADGRSNRYYVPQGTTDGNGRFEITHIRPGETWIVAGGAILDARTRQVLPKDMLQKILLKAEETVDNIRLVSYSFEELQALHESR